MTTTLSRSAMLAYDPGEFWDEMFAAPGEPRAPYDALVSVLQPMDPAELRFRADTGGSPDGDAADDGATHDA